MAQNRPLMSGGQALLGIVDALCPSVGRRDKEGSIRKQKLERRGMELCRGPSVSIKTHTAPKNPKKTRSKKLRSLTNFRQFWGIKGAPTVRKRASRKTENAYAYMHHSELNIGFVVI